MNSFLMALWLVATFGGNPVTLYPDTSEPFVMRQGYVNCEPVWYVPFAASNQKLALQLDEFVRARHKWCNNGVEWAPALSCALDKDAIGDVYMLNCGQCVVFSTQPGEDDYTPLWRVHYLEWKPPLPKVCLCSEEEILQALNDGDLFEVIPPSVLDATIIIPTSKIPSVELAYLSYAKKKVKFYCFTVFPPETPKCYYSANTADTESSDGPKWKCPKQACLLITDTNDADLAAAVGANYAPNMVSLAPDCCSCAYAFVDPAPPGQYPVLCEVPDDGSWIPNQSLRVPWGNINKDYSPILCWTLLDRDTAPEYAVFTTLRGIEEGLFNGSILKVPTPDPVVTNSPLSNGGRVVKMVTGV